MKKNIALALVSLSAGIVLEAYLQQVPGVYTCGHFDDLGLKASIMAVIHGAMVYGIFNIKKLFKAIS